MSITTHTTDLKFGFSKIFFMFLKDVIYAY